MIEFVCNENQQFRTPDQDRLRSQRKTTEDHEEIEDHEDVVDAQTKVDELLRAPRFSSSLRVFGIDASYHCCYSQSIRDPHRTGRLVQREACGATSLAGSR